MITGGYNAGFRFATGLWVDFYELTMAAVSLRYRRNCKATFELFMRSGNRPFYLLSGIQDALFYVKNLKFTDDDIAYLQTLKTFDEEFLRYLRNFKFSGDIWACEEGSVVFAHEPLIRVRANLIEAQILESAFLNIINLQTTLATKAARIVLAAQARRVYDFSLRRTQGFSASLAAAKCSFLAGAQGTANVLAGRFYGIPVVGTMAHSFVMSFSREIEAFKYFADSFPEKTTLLIDTYNRDSGLRNAIRVARYLKNKKHKRLLGVRIDSGDLLEYSHYVRNTLDYEGLVDTAIVASGNLDEHSIKSLVDKGAPIDAFGVGTHMGTSSDQPFCDVVYKICEVAHRKSEFIPVMKLSSLKENLPFAKQIHRTFSSNGIIQEDIVSLDQGSPRRNCLLKKVMENGEVLALPKDLVTLQSFARKNLQMLPEELKALSAKTFSCVRYDPAFEKKVSHVKAQALQRSHAEGVLFFDVDTQTDFLHPKGNLYIPHAESIIKNLVKLTEHARIHGIPVFSSLDTHSKNDPEFNQFAPHCVEGTRGQAKLKETLLKSHIVVSGKENYSFEQILEIKELYQQIIFLKNTIDVFSNNALTAFLDIYFPKSVYIYGVATEHCVKAAAIGLAKNVDEVFVLTDAIQEISPAAREKTFAAFKKNNISCVDTAQVLHALGVESKK